VKEKKAPGTQAKEKEKGAPNSEVTEFKHIRIGSTFWTWLCGDSARLKAAATGQLIKLANMRTEAGELTEDAQAIRALENNDRGAMVYIDVTNSNNIFGFGTHNPDVFSFDSYITYNPLFYGETDTHAAEEGITILAHELSHARDYAWLRSAYFAEKNKHVQAHETEFEAVRVENQIRAILGMELRTVYEFGLDGGNVDVSEHDKYKK